MPQTREVDPNREARDAADEVQRTSDTERDSERDVEPVNTPNRESGDTALPLDDEQPRHTAESGSF
ncbi:MAG: hypothetical protein H0V86_13930 [Chloroflexia bacterium]|nr:hypothetical protein [Chloroflexia bacterium]